MKTIGAGVLVAAMLVLIPAAARGEMLIGGGGGAYVPYNGKVGFNALAQFLAKRQDSGWRFGGEFEYRNFKGEIFDVKNVGINAVCLRGVVEYEFNTPWVRPYLGGGFGITFNIYDSDKVEDERGNLETITNFGTGIGLLALVGAEVPVGAGFALFAEGRTGGEFQLTDDSEDISFASLGGFGGVGGVRFRF